MLFNSWQYAVFLPTVCILYYSIPHRVRWMLLLATSYYFYMSWNPNLIFLILFTTATSYVSALIIENSKNRKTKKIRLVGGVSISLIFLFYFKYFNFFSSSVTSILRRFSLPAKDILVNVILPVGISFYTFQTLSYVIDVYKGDLHAEKHFGIYALYVSFFPQLVAGPIERAVTLLPQFKQEHYFDVQNASWGCHMIAWGLFKKVVIADTCAIYVDTIFGDLAGYPSMAYLIAILLFAFQIYCDFSGYSDIAIGSAKILGFDLMENFNSPYFSLSIKEFWRRWHISLSTWFKDYVYIPLGGNRRGTRRTLINLFITFLVSGLWHGASWNFVIWGGLFGLFNIVDYFTLPKKKKRLANASTPTKLITNILSWAICFGIVCFCWIFFRASTFRDALHIIKSLPSALRSPLTGVINTIGLLGVSRLKLAVLIFSLAMLFIYDFINRFYRSPIPLLQAQHPIIKWSIRFIICTVILLTALTLPEGVTVEFIYFQF